MGSGSVTLRHFKKMADVEGLKLEDATVKYQEQRSRPTTVWDGDVMGTDAQEILLRCQVANSDPRWAYFN